MKLNLNLFGKKHSCVGKSYPIERIDTCFGHTRFIIKLYSGKRIVKLIIDSGAQQGLLLENKIHNCDYEELGTTDSMFGVSGEIPVRKIRMRFSFNKENAKRKPKYELIFNVTSDNGTILSIGCESHVAGLLGADFLSKCSVDFVNLRLTILQ